MPRQTSQLGQPPPAETEKVPPPCLEDPGDLGGQLARVRWTDGKQVFRLWQEVVPPDVRKINPRPMAALDFGCIFSNGRRPRFSRVSRKEDVKYPFSHWLEDFRSANKITCNDPIWLCLALGRRWGPQFQPAASPPTAVTSNQTSGYKLRPSSGQTRALDVFTQHHNSHSTAFL